MWLLKIIFIINAIQVGGSETYYKIYEDCMIALDQSQSTAEFLKQFDIEYDVKGECVREEQASVDSWNGRKY